jgi:hypothetical protein
MRSALAVAVLTGMFSTAARAELVQAELNGHITSILENGARPVSSAFAASTLGFPIGGTVQGRLSYVTNPNPAASYTGYGLSLTVAGKYLVSSGSYQAWASPIHFLFPSGSLEPMPVPGMYVSNGLRDALPPGQLNYGLAQLVAPDPQGQLLGTAVAPGPYVDLPGPAALAAYSTQANGANISLGFAVGNASYIANIAVDSITVDPTTAAQAPEPSSLLLFGLGGLSLLGLAPRRIRGRIVPDAPGLSML